MISFAQSCTNSVTATASFSLSVIMGFRPHPQQSRRGKQKANSGIVKQENRRHTHSANRQVSTGNTKVKLSTAIIATKYNTTSSSEQKVRSPGVGGASNRRVADE